jgi:polar amino acid transport system substrate-binding protein
MCGAAPAARTEVSLCADVWCPYNCDPGSNRPGFAVEIARAVFTRAGYTVTYQAAGWARCIEDTRAGRFTAIIGAIRADAPDFTFPKQPIGNSSAAYAVRKGDPFRYTGTHAFEGRVIATVRDYSFGGETGAYIDAHAHDGRYVEFVAGDDALQKNLAKLVAGRVDLVLDDENVLRSKIAALALQDKVTVVHGPSSSPLFIAFSPASPDRAELARILDSGIAQLRARRR